MVALGLALWMHRAPVKMILAKVIETGWNPQSASFTERYLYEAGSMLASRHVSPVNYPQTWPVRRVSRVESQPGLLAEEDCRMQGDVAFLRRKG